MGAQSTDIVALQTALAKQKFTGGPLTEAEALATFDRRVPAVAPLNIPTPDGLPSVGHPDVLHIPGGWNGYAYWMGFTPYPAESRENPCIVASNDGVTWEVPAGLTNPIAPLSEATALGYNYWSDTDLVHLPDGRLACYFRGTKQNDSEGIYRKVSSDGVTWGPLELCFTAGFTTCLSPAVVVEADNTFTLWSVDHTQPQGSTARVTRRTSPDGVTWSAPVACTIPAANGSGASEYVWHIDVIRVGGTYHALMATRNVSFRLLYRTSTDGLTWTGPARFSVPATGLPFDQFGNYRSTLLAKPGGKFDVYVTGITSPDGESGVFTTAQWRLGLLRDVELRADKYLPQLSDDVLWTFANDFTQAFGTPTWSVSESAPVVVLGDSSTHSVTAILPPPPSHWNTYAIEAMISNPNTVAGDVRLGSRYYKMATGIVMQPGTEVLFTTTVDETARKTYVVTLHPSIANEASLGRPVRVSCYRIGADAADTLVGSLHLIGVRLRRLT